MSDLFGLTAVSNTSLAARPERPKAVPAIAPPEKSAAGSGATGGNVNPDTTPRQNRAGSDPIPGPPPAFEASLLELESDLQSVIRRVEAAREKARDLHAVAPDLPSPAPAEPPKIDPQTEANGTPRREVPYSREA